MTGIPYIKGIDGQSIGYTLLPRRRIVERWTEILYGDLNYPVAMLTLECGHTQHNRGQKTYVRCWECYDVASADSQ